jgi:hypothetical protein
MSDIKQRLETFIKHDRLTDWQRSFGTSLLDQFNRRGSLSVRQVQVLAQQETYLLEEAPVDDWNQEKADLFERCALWYRNTTHMFPSIIKHIYFNVDTQDHAHSIDWSRSKVPTKRAFNRLTKNKYAKRMIQNVLEPPKYGVGSFVTIRNIGTLPWEVRRLPITSTGHDGKAHQVPYIVVENDGPKRQPGSTKGSRKYSIMLPAESSFHEVEERYIKAYRPKKS